MSLFILQVVDTIEKAPCYQKEKPRCDYFSVVVTVIPPSTGIFAQIYGDPEEHPQAESYWGHVNPIGYVIMDANIVVDIGVMSIL